MSNKMDEKDFALEEYKTLRKEILDKMDRNYKTLGLGVGGITVLFGLAFQYQVYELFFVLPLFILANAYRYRAEKTAIIIAGEYIRKIENSIYRKDSTTNKNVEDKLFGDMGWENYLNRAGRRKDYEPFAHTGDLIFGGLYVICILGMWNYNQNISLNIPSTDIQLYIPSVLIILSINLIYIIIGIFFWNILSKIKQMKLKW